MVCQFDIACKKQKKENKTKHQKQKEKKNDFKIFFSSKSIT
jgi:hypothetical protein